jgi:membrane protein
MLAAVPFVLLLVIGLGHLAQTLSGPTVDPADVFRSFFPLRTAAPGRDPFEVIERLLVSITRNRGQISLYAIPAFVWFSTRLFAGVRTSLNDIFDVSLRPAPRRNFLVLFVLAKLRDIGMVVGTVVLFLANTALTTALAVLQARGAERVPQLAFFVSNLGRVMGELLTFVFSVSLFFVTYRFASVRKLPRLTVLLASTFSAILFEIAKRLYGLYLANFASLEAHIGDANLGAIVLFVLWIYYTALVFLLGAVVAETWELRLMQQRQRAILQ